MSELLDRLPRMTLIGGHTWSDWKYAMHHWAHYHGVAIPSAFNPHTEHCGPPCGTLMKRIKQHAGIRVEKGFGPKTQALLHPLLPGPTPRERFMSELQWGVDHEPEIHYAFDVPTPLERWKRHELPISTNCTRSVTSAAYAAGIVDPNGLGYKGDGFTGSWLQHLRHIGRLDVQLGDLIVFGSGEGDHGVAVMEVHADPVVFSHGFEGGPQKLPLSVEARYHVGQPITYLRMIFTEL